MKKLTALDLFAGTGWGVACQQLGIDEVGVEIMPEARATREANGMKNWLSDVWDVLENAPEDSPEFQSDILIASPPCQTFSLAGGGAGRRALDEVISLIDSGAYLNPAELRNFGELHDPRTALVLTPLTYIARHVPTYVALEQVPQVRPVWERYAEELRKWGYSVAVDTLHAEQYGVPQTRKRAILIARCDGLEVKMPEPTHSRYHTRSPEKLDLGVLRWVSMAEALGWSLEGGARYFHPMTYGRRAIWPGNEPAPTIRGVQRNMPETYSPHERDAVVMRSNYGTGGDPADRGERHGEEPSATITSKAGRSKWLHGETGEPMNLDPQKPATTVAADPRLTSREHHYYGEQNATSTKVTVAEASMLQTYPEDFDWWHDFRSDRGRVAPLTATKAFLQIGNAFPPLLAKIVLSSLLGGRP